MKGFFKLLIIGLLFTIFILILVCILVKYDIEKHFEEERGKSLY